jgi:hypothetical protein
MTKPTTPTTTHEHPAGLTCFICAALGIDVSQSPEREARIRTATRRLEEAS